MAMKLVFTQNSPLDTTLVDEARGAVVYQIATEKNFLSKTTVIRKPFINQQGMFVPGTFTEVARIRWKTLSSDKIVFYGNKMKREEFMPKAGIFTHGFLITVNGMEYRWSTKKGLPRLVTNNNDKMLIAKLHEKKKVLLEVSPAGFAMLDMVAVSLVYVETKRREEEDSKGDEGKEGGHGGKESKGKKVKKGKKGGKGGKEGKEGEDEVEDEEGDEESDSEEDDGEEQGAEEGGEVYVNPPVEDYGGEVDGGEVYVDPPVENYGGEVDGGEVVSWI